MPVLAVADLGGALIARAAEYARNSSLTRVYVHSLVEHGTIIRLARRAGMDVVFDSGDADGHLELQPAAPLSFTRELSGIAWRSLTTR